MVNDQQPEALKKSEVKSATISLDMDGKPILFILLAKDGTINRMGSATEDSVNDDMVVGVTQTGLFDKFMNEIDEEMLEHSGAFESPDIKGHKCMISLFLTGETEEQKAAFQFTYGSASAGPPRRIGDLVMKAMSITQAWFEEQKLKLKASGTKVDIPKS